MTETPETPTPSLAERLEIDIESMIHEHCGSDWSDDAHNDWVNDLTQAIVGPVATQLRQLDRIKAALGPVWTADEIRWAVGDGRVPKMAYYPLSDMLLRLADALEADDGA